MSIIRKITKIKAPEFLLNYNNKQEIVNEYTLRNLMLERAKGEHEGVDITVEGLLYTETGPAVYATCIMDDRGILSQGTLVGLKKLTDISIEHFQLLR